MTPRKAATFALFVALTIYAGKNAHSNNSLFPLGPGFTLSDSVGEFSLTYFTVDNLIVLPFLINGNVRVNLILDTGCQTLILFGKRYEQMFDIVPDFRVTFSGMGNGKPAVGSVSLQNTVTLGPLEGEHIPIVIVPGKKVLRRHLQVDGLIGYDLFTRFEIELHPIRQEIIFRSAFNRTLPRDYHHIPLSLSHHRPTINATFALPDREVSAEMLVDTGSTLYVLLKSSDKEHLTSKTGKETLGMGINGIISGSRTIAQRLHLHEYTATDVPVAITYSPWHDYASVGMAFLKNYSVIINYVQGYIGLREPEEPIVAEEIL
ncbi:MAG: aspartyl protease family protein [Cyclobacteriaceae bacterium]|nr:aspartyl protease family protein [Cyclobacteriaceae bacterium]